MKKLVKGVAASSACWFLGAVGAVGVVGVGLATTAWGQPGTPTPPPEPRPYFYLWEGPEVGGTNISSFASQMVWEYAEWPPLDRAISVRDRALCQIHEPPLPPNCTQAEATTDPDHVCILLRNFGHWVWKPNWPPKVPYPDMVSFLDEQDAVSVDWFNGVVPDESERLHSLQPWMTQGRIKVKDWMTKFLTAYKANGGPVPLRFHFDTEEFPSGCCDVNYTRVLEAVYKDTDRWNNLPVPGSADYLVPSGGLPKTMATMYADAIAVFGWPNLPLYHPQGGTFQALAHDQGPNHLLNRKYFAWYWEICQRAMDAAMEECAYDVITSPAFYPPSQYPDLKVSNYGHANMDGKSDVFGWYSGHPDTTDPNAPGPLTPLRVSVRGMPEDSQSGALHLWNDFIEYVPGTQTIVRRNLWRTVPGRASGDFSSPVLYPQDPEYWKGADRKNYYLNGWPALNENIPGVGEIGAGRAAIMSGRQFVESILNSGTVLQPERWRTIVPWIAPPHVPFDWNEKQDLYDTRYEDLRDTLAMLRAKRTPEIIVWWNKATLSTFQWETTKQIMDRVYLPQHVSNRVLTGLCQNCPPGSPNSVSIDRLRYTLRETNPNDEFIQIATANETDPPEIALRVRFNNVIDAGGNEVALNLECSVNPAQDVSAANIIGNIYVWTGAGWELQTTETDDYPNDPAINGFGFFAPVNDQPPNPGWYETRRTFEHIAKHVVGQGPTAYMDVKIVLQRIGQNAAPFSARVDLVQLVGKPTVIGGGAAAAGVAQGADFNHTQQVSTDDITGFYEAYTAGEPSADFNNDEVVDAQDLAEYTLEYVNPK